MKTIILPTPFSKADAVILANGEFPVHSVPLSILKNNPYIVCCDGAIDKLAPTGIEPQAIVGDCDSLSQENRIKYAEIIHRIEEQDTNDLTKSVMFCLEKGLRNIIILGATGRREDHSIGNISLLADYIDHVDNISMISNYGVFNAVNDNTRFESFPGQQVSVFCIEPAHLNSIGLKYPLAGKLFSSWWQATLNEAEKEEFIIYTQRKIIVFRVFP